MSKRTSSISSKSIATIMPLSKKRNISIGNIYNNIINILKEHSDNNYCIYKKDSNYKIKNFTLSKQLGNNKITGHGKVFLLEYNNIKIAVKIFIDTNDKEEQLLGAKTELSIFKLINDLHNNKKIEKCNLIHFPIIYIMDKCPITTLHLEDDDDSKYGYINDIIKYKYNLIFTRLANGTLEDFIKNEFIKLYDTDIYNIINTIVQIVFSVYFFHEYTNHIHDDLHWNNMLYFSVSSEDKDIQYKINKKKYQFVNKNLYLWNIWDFDTCKKIDKCDDYKKDYKIILTNFDSNYHISNIFLYNPLVKKLSDYDDTKKININEKIKKRLEMYNTIKDLNNDEKIILNNLELLFALYQYDIKPFYDEIIVILNKSSSEKNFINEFIDYVIKLNLITEVS